MPVRDARASYPCIIILPFAVAETNLDGYYRVPDTGTQPNPNRVLTFARKTTRFSYGMSVQNFRNRRKRAYAGLWQRAWMPRERTF